MPTQKAILEYWAQTLIDNFGKYWMDIYNEHCPTKIKTSYCFACGSSIGTQRCHIVPSRDGGSEDVSNLHLLCKECHVESEDLCNEQLYYEWFKAKNPSNSASVLRIQNKVNLMIRLKNEGKTEMMPDYIKDILKSIS
jgi:hypothetical protein